jgi:hypothetical protein
MLKYIANPVEVDAFVIAEVVPASRVESQILKVGDVIETAPCFTRPRRCARG